MKETASKPSAAVVAVAAFGIGFATVSLTVWLTQFLWHAYQHGGL